MENTNTIMTIIVVIIVMFTVLQAWRAWLNSKEKRHQQEIIVQLSEQETERFERMAELYEVIIAGADKTP